MNVIARLDFKLAYYDSAVQLFNHYITRTPPWNWVYQIAKNIHTTYSSDRYAYLRIITNYYYLCFKAFDSIHWGKMKQIVLAYSLLKETVAAIMMLYRNTKVKVRSPDGDTDYFDIVAGVPQGDTLVFNLKTRNIDLYQKFGLLQFSLKLLWLVDYCNFLFFQHPTSCRLFHIVISLTFYSTWSLVNQSSWFKFKVLHLDNKYQIVWHPCHYR